MKLLESKVAIVTGGSRGIGKAICQTFAENGCDVAFTYNNSKESAENLAKELKNIGINAKAYKSDASSFDDATQLVEDVINDFGKIDILVNNAGIKKDNLLMRMNKEDFDSVVNTNLSSVFNLTKASIRTFLKQRSGSIINISSVVGVKGNAGQSNYSASKAGIIGFSKSVALELGSRNIRSNVIAPGFIETDMTDSLSEDVINSWKESIPLKRGGKPSDVGNACVFLASDMSSYITGQVLHIDGGMLT
ncbi:MAG: 3-oxoacyl-[acyl-carrier-protein] reductase [Cryomorphaceae bacterium]|jgi:3-oxoacyl-[acyl-carrier protein] reductase|nr:3-oxoacyl-[acyl-carrier-protein] reductase [Cryomorphaceae bacterium]MDC6466275.1 3-oxoacyl-[acyl-carrier-protein] reductase [Flavobacteriaceae bacterium]MBT3685263.1 3-oxoacyl-[acyl-carrier-protein] reductase [Cryomorphaceae bacterium]MBT4237694.1 3-oxoacyl-[acyl-carrier-protein] reductase [Cryomorphaceae bacterium]MBT4813858.1 3-oxoacyl-[acyl-carrier-protein] reductase [Cryomorphaceae bacterium]|tara:strand:- start:2908 stop:3654 length:747 start_codon:yes stop_codon:yes gene_type:complete